MTVPTAEELAAHPAFRGLLQINLTILPAHARATAGLDAEALSAREAEANALARRLRGRMREQSQITGAETARLAALAGLNPDGLTGLLDRAATQGAALAGAFPDLATMDDHARNMLVFDVLRRDDDLAGALKSAATTVAAADEASLCKNQCLATLVMDLLRAQLDAVNRMLACAFLVFPPLVMLCAAVMIAIMLAVMTAANNRYTECVEQCLKNNNDNGGGGQPD